MVATRLSANQRFEEANRWFEFIFRSHARKDRRKIAFGTAGPCMTMRPV
ncbi:MAG: hypothetical protein IPG32_07530 [Saprospirales bacterium]|nr:hypothetical protein [Saprospirales bacterium]